MLETVNPAPPNFSEIHEMLKFGSNCGNIRKRWFTLDDNNFLQFKSQNDQKPSKIIPLLGATSLFERQDPTKPILKWLDAKSSVRITLNLITNKKKKIVYIYHTDENLLKGLQARIRIASSPSLKKNLPNYMHKLSLVFNIICFEKFWKQICDLNTIRVRRLVAIQMIGLNLVDVAGLAWQRSRMLLQRVEKKVWQNIDDTRKRLDTITLTKVKSTFKFGRPKRTQISEFIIPACVINKRAEQLATFVRTRKTKRDLESQAELEFLCKNNYHGYNATSIKIQSFSSDTDGKIISERIISDNNAQIYLDGNSIQIEDLNPAVQKNTSTTLLALNEVSFISTDLIEDVNRRAEMEKQKEYSIVIYGPLLPQTLHIPKTVPNAPPELSQLAPLSQKKTNYFQIEINSISLPYTFVQKYNNKCYIRVRLNQYKSQSPVNSSPDFYVNSEDIALSLKDQGLKQTNNLVELQTNIIFNIDRLIDLNTERFSMSVLYIYARQPVPNVLMDYVMRTEYQGFHIKNVSSLIDYVDTKFIQAIQLTHTENDKEIITLRYNVKQIKNQLSQQLDYREGQRLLIGRFCILDQNDSAQLCQVTQFNRDNSVQLRTVNSHQVIEKKISLERIKMIERYGVSVYQNSNLPQELGEFRYAWKIQIRTTEKRFVNMIQFAIQKQHVALAFKRRQQQQQNRIASGKIILSLLEVRSLCLSKAFNKKDELRPFIKITVTDQNQVISVAHKSDVLGINEDVLDDNETQNIDLSKIASWVNQNFPTGQIFHLGIFEKKMPADQSVSQILKLQVFNNGKYQELLGECTIRISDIIDLQEQAKELSTLLQFEKQTAGIITIQTRFIPDKNTRHKFNINLATQKLQTPEGYLHLQQTLQLDLNDKYSYQLPLGKYNWNQHTSANYLTGFQSRLRPTILKDQTSFQQCLFQTQLKQQFISVHQYLDASVNDGSNSKMKETLKSMMSQRVFINQEEARDIQVWILNQKRPMRQEFTVNLMNLWTARKIRCTQDAQRQLCNYQWDQFLKELPQIKLTLSENEILTQNQDITDSLIQKVYENQQVTEQIKNFSLPKLHNIDLDKILFSGIWEKSKIKQEIQQYSDLYNLIKYHGIAEQLRSRIWRELLKVQIIEFEEVYHFKQTIGIKSFNNNKTIYQNYVAYADSLECLAFRQVDEDVKFYNFPEGYLNNFTQEIQIGQILRERFSIRKILRSLILWSRQRKVNGKDVSFSYSQGTLDVIQRILATTQNKDEDAFWILVGLIKFFPIPFSVSDSVLQGDCFSVMRSEFVTFKALVEQNLPKIHRKLKLLGMSIEILVYKPITSMYATYFSSELTLRLWDLIFLSFSTSVSNQRIQGLWYILAPAFLVLKKVEKQILEAQNCEEVVVAFEAGRILWYDPIEFFKELNALIEQLFIEETTTQDQNILISMMFGKNIKVGNKNAFEMEELRNKYFQRTKTLFKPVQAENKFLSDFLKQQSDGQTIDTTIISQTILKEFKEISNQNTLDQKNLTKSTQSKHDMQLGQVHIFVHRLTKMPACSQNKFALKITYGFIGEETGIFQPYQICEQIPTEKSKKLNPGLIYQTELIETHTFFPYKTGVNFIKIELFEGNLVGKQISYGYVCLSDLEQDRFTQRLLILRNPSIIENTQSFVFSFSQLQVTFFLQRPVQLDQIKTIDKNQILSAFAQKTPDVIDFFNRAKYQDLTQEFINLVKIEFNELNSFMEQNQTLEIINESYNYVQSEQFNNNTTLQRFIEIAKQLLPPHLNNEKQIIAVYKIFTGQLIDVDIKAHQEIELARRVSLRKVVVASFDNNSIINKTKLVNQSNKIVNEELVIPFSLRQFLTSIILLSLSTVEEKVSILYELFEFAGRSKGQIRLQQAYQLIQVVMNRSLYFISQNELMTMCEHVFNGQVSIVRKAIWTPVIKSTRANFMQQITLQELAEGQQKFQTLNQEQKLECFEVNITEAIQHSFTNYFSVFGTKVIDFNPDTSPFKNLKNLVGDQYSDLLLSLSNQKSFQIVLYLQANGENFNFYVVYSTITGELLHAGSSISNQISNQNTLIVNDVSTYLQRNSSRLFLNGDAKPITKQELLKKLENFPMFANLIRVETFYQDRIQNKFIGRTILVNPLIVTLVFESIQFKFEFLQTNIFETLEGSQFTISQDKLEYKFRMKSVFQTTLLVEIRHRILSAFTLMSKVNNNQSLTDVKINQILEQIAGGREWSNLSNRNWIQVQDFMKINELSKNKDCIVLKLRPRIQTVNVMSRQYNCLSLYKHGDQSYEWRPCRIIRRELLPQNLRQNILFDEQAFNYIIEFEHEKEAGEKMWFKRCAPEILFSKEYTRYELNDFQRNTLNYLIQLYQGRDTTHK